MGLLRLHITDRSGIYRHLYSWATDCRILRKSFICHYIRFQHSYAKTHAWSPETSQISTGILPPVMPGCFSHSRILATIVIEQSMNVSFIIMYQVYHHSRLFVTKKPCCCCWCCLRITRAPFVLINDIFKCPSWFLILEIPGTNANSVVTE